MKRIALLTLSVDPATKSLGLLLHPSVRLKKQGHSWVLTVQDFQVSIVEDYPLGNLFDLIDQVDRKSDESVMTLGRGE
jgi:hypothetical protein